MFEQRYEGYKKEFKTESARKYYEQFGYKVDSAGMVKNDLQKYDIQFYNKSRLQLIQS